MYFRTSCKICEVVSQSKLAPVISLFVKINYAIIASTEYTIDYNAKTITFNTAPIVGSKIHLAVLGVSGTKIIDIDNFVADGSTNTYATNFKYQEGVSHYVTIDGQTITSTLTKGTDGWFVINFNTAPQSGQVVDYGLFYTTATNFSATNVQTLVGDGSTTVFDVNPAIEVDAR